MAHGLFVRFIFYFFILFLFLRGGIVGIDAFLLHNVEED